MSKTARKSFLKLYCKNCKEVKDFVFGGGQYVTDKGTADLFFKCKDCGLKVYFVSQKPNDLLVSKTVKNS